MNRTLSRPQRRSLGQSLSLITRNVVFTAVVPGLGGAWLGSRRKGDDGDGGDGPSAPLK